MKKIVFLLTLVMLLGLFAGCHSGEPMQQPTEEPTKPTVLGVKEEKVYCNATLDDEFEEYSVMVVMTNIASLQFNTYTPEDFPEIQCAEVNDLSTAAASRVQAKLNGEYIKDVNIYEYNQILCLRLKNPGKQNVLDAIKELEKREDIKSANPNYILSID